MPILWHVITLMVEEQGKQKWKDLIQLRINPYSSVSQALARMRG